MSVALAMMAVSMAGTVLQGIQKDEQLKAQRDIQKFNEKAMEVKLKTESAQMIENQHKSFSNFMEGHESVVASQENYLNATGYDERGTVRQGVYQEQKDDFYGSQQTSESNIADIEAKTELALLGQRAQNEINKTNFKQGIESNKLSTLTSFFGSAVQMGATTGAFTKSPTPTVTAGSISSAPSQTGQPLLGFGDSSTMLA